MEEPLNKVKAPPRPSGNQWKYKENSFTTSPSEAIKPSVSDGARSASNRGNPSCHLCSHAHDLDYCKLFSKKTPQLIIKRAFLQEKNMCFGCCGTNHLSRNCSKRKSANTKGGPTPLPFTSTAFSYLRRKTRTLLKFENGNAVRNACNYLQDAPDFGQKCNVLLKVARRG